MSDFVAMVGLLRPFGDAIEQAGFECEVRVRDAGGSADRITYRTGGYAEGPPVVEDLPEVTFESSDVGEDG